MISTPSVPTCILVLGMHRSGTSALARLLSLLGADLPTNLMPAREGNEEGHWEPQRLVDLNDAIFAEIDSRWSDCRSIDLTRLSPSRWSHYQGEIVRLIGEDFPGSRLFVVKDPRICRLLPLWRNALADLGADVRCAISFRHPLEVAQSLERRNDLPLSHGCLLWLRHLLEAECATRGLERVFVDFDKLTGDPIAVTSLLASKLLENARAISDDDKKAITSFVDPRLRHHVASRESLGDRIAYFPCLNNALEAHRLLAADPTDASAQQALDDISETLEARLGDLGTVLAEGEIALRQRDDRVALLEGEIEALLEKQRRYQSEIQELLSSTSWRITAPLRATGNLARQTKKEPE